MCSPCPIRADPRVSSELSREATAESRGTGTHLGNRPNGPHDLEACVQEGLDDVDTQEAGGTGDEDLCDGEGVSREGRAEEIGEKDGPWNPARERTRT